MQLFLKKYLLFNFRYDIIYLEKDISFNLLNYAFITEA